jgi:hypothetical protein
MALPEDEQREIESRAKELVLTDFRDEFQSIYSYAVAVLEVVPEQANNEIRNALNHISRALDGNSLEDAKSDLKKAEGHIDRAKRDCFKLANIHLHEQLRSDFLDIEVIEGAVPLSVRQRLAVLEQRGVDARKSEAQGGENVLELLATLFADQKVFREDLHNQFTVPGRLHAKTARFFIRVRRQGIILLLGFSMGVASSLIAAAIYSHYFAAAPSAPPPKATAVQRPA